MDGSLRVVALKGSEPVGAWEFDKEIVSIGRSKTADVRLDDAAISRVHCIVESRPAGVFIKDNGSRNGLWLNGKRVAEAMLSSRDEVVVERYRIKAYLVWGQNTAAKKYGDRTEENTHVPGQSTSLQMAAVRAAAVKPKQAPAMEMTAPVAQPRAARGVTAEMEEILADVRPSSRPAAALPKKPALEATAAAPARPSSKPKAAPVAAETPARREDRRAEERRVASAAPIVERRAEPRRNEEPRRKAARPIPPAPVYDEFADEDDEEETLAPAFDMTGTIASTRMPRLAEDEKTIVEVVRYRGVNVLEVARLERGQSYTMPFVDMPLVSFDGDEAVVDVADGMSAELLAGKNSEAVAGSVGVRYGEMLDVKVDDIGYLVRLAGKSELKRSPNLNGLALGLVAGGVAGGASISLHVFVAAVLMLVQMMKPEVPEFREFAKIEMPKDPEPLVAAATPTPEPPKAKETPVPPQPKMKEPPTKLAKRPQPQAQPVGGAEKTEAKVASAGVLGGLGKVNVKLDSPSSALAAVTNLDAVRSTSGRGGGFKVGALTGKIPGDAVLGRSGRANGTVEISTLSGNDLGARGGFGGHALNGGGKVRGVVTQTPTSNVGVQGTLSQAEIAAVVNKHLTEIRRCYEKNLINDPSLNGKIQVEWTINPDGTVAGVKTKFSSMKGGDVSGCIGGAIRTWAFPRPHGNGYVIVNYPFMFDSVGF